MHDDHQTRFGCQMLAGAVVIFLVCTIWSWREMRYALGGETAIATITQAREVTKRRRGLGKLLGESRRLELTWSYQRGDEHVMGTQMLPVDHPLPEDGKLPIVWLAGDPPASRVKGTGSAVPVIVFLASCAAMAWAARRAWQQADADVARSKRG
jgi:hypothetical protein